MTTLTLTLDDETAARTRELARLQGKSIDEVVAQLIHAAADVALSETLPPITRSLIGISKPMSDQDVRTELGSQKESRWGGT